MKPIAAFLSFLLAAPAFLAAQGSLQPPPGAPGPVMKTLDQIEPRRDLATVPGVANAKHRIDVPGSYYLSGNVVVEPGHELGIHITVSNVTLDLNGFHLTSTHAANTGIMISNGVNDVIIRNGSISNFQSGIWAFNGESTGGLIRDILMARTFQQGIRGGSGYVIENCIVRNATGVGIQVGEGSTLRHCTVQDIASGSAAIRTGAQSRIEHCTVHGTSTALGIDAGEGNFLTHCIVQNTVSTTAAIRTGAGAMIINCTSRNNTTPFGINAGANSILTDCIASGNTASSSTSYGVNAGTDSTLTRITAVDNTTSAASPSSSNGIGIAAGLRSTIRHCTANNNSGDGFVISTESVFENNLARGNGLNNTATGSAGVRTAGFRSLIRNNHINNNTVGLRVTSWPNLIIANTLRANGTNFVISQANRVGEIVTVPSSPAIDGNTGGSGVGTTDPYANLTY